jgi:hypothetical protein
MKTLKHEEVHPNGYETLQDVIARLPHFLNEVYNARRLHSALVGFSGLTTVGEGWCRWSPSEDRQAGSSKR